MALPLLYECTSTGKQGRAKHRSRAKVALHVPNMSRCMNASVCAVSKRGRQIRGGGVARTILSRG
eukprot:4640081-Pleurochrysis_carterae.AAC.1